MVKMAMEQKTNGKLEYLQQLFKTYGDFELWRVDKYDSDAKKVISAWQNWKKYSTCTDEEKEKANLRSVLREEVILDIEEPSRLEPILQELRQMPVNYLVFETGSRGYHIHIVFPELKQKENNEVTLIKDSIIKHFGCDISKKSERNLIALEHEPHFKTGKTKRLVSFKSDATEQKLDIFLAMTIKLAKLLSTEVKFSDVFKGKWEAWGYPSRSEAEEYLCTTLAINRFTPQEVFAIMEMSQVGKWKEKTFSYKELTIKKAFEFAEKLPKVTEEFSNEPLFRMYEDYGIPQPVSWLVPNYICSKGVTILSGSAGTGKSFISEEIVSSILGNRKLFNSMDIIHDQPVILIDMENDFSTLYERLQKLGGIPTGKLYIFNFNRNFDMMNKQCTDELKALVDKVQPCMVIFDTLRRTYSGDENNSQYINEIYKSVLAPISKERCVFIIAHSRKSLGKNAVEDDELADIRGTSDITGLASVVIKLKPNIDSSITLKVVKMRVAKRPEPITVKLEETDGKFVWKLLDNPTKTLSELEIITDKMFAWLEQNVAPMGEVRTKDMINAFKGENFNSRCVERAIQMLKAKNILVIIRKGLYRFVYGDDSLKNFIQQ
jgi:hypothetical protein